MYHDYNTTWDDTFYFLEFQAAHGAEGEDEPRQGVGEGFEGGEAAREGGVEGQAGSEQEEERGKCEEDGNCSSCKWDFVPVF